MTGMTAKGLATRQRIVEGAADLVRTTGVDSTTLDEICATTSTSRSQLFHYFPQGRRELLLAVAHFEAERVLSDQQPHLSNLTTWESWQQWKTVVVERYRRQGRTCPLAVLMGELGRPDPDSQEVTRLLLHTWRADLAVGIATMQSRSEVTSSLDPDRYAGALMAGIQGGVTILLATGSSADLESALDLLLEPLRPAPVLTRPA